MHRVLGYRPAGGCRVLRLYSEAGGAAGAGFPQHRVGLADCPGVGQAQFGDQLVLKGLRHALDPALAASLTKPLA